MTATHCFVAMENGHFGQKHIVADIVHPISGKGMYGKRSQSELEQKYGPIQVMTFDEYDKLHDQDWRQAPRPITKEQYTYALEVLPPVNWVQHKGASTFAMSEHLSGEMTSIYAYVDKQYFHLIDNWRTPHDTIIAACRQVLANQSTQN